MHTIREEAIIQIISARLKQDTRTCGQMIEVSFMDGEVLLSGTSDTEEQRETATIIAQGTYGVRTVIDRIRVRKITQSI